MLSPLEYNLKKYSKKYLNKIGIHLFDRALMVPRMTTQEFLFFSDFLKKNNNAIYYESGSGGSTLMAEKIFSKMYSFETDAGFVGYMNSLLSNVEVQLIPVGVTGKFGYPEHRTVENVKRISGVFTHLLKEKKESHSIVFIDGRSRVSTALEIHKYLQVKDRVLIHDFKRKHYHAVLKVYSIVQQVDGLVILQRKTKAEKEVKGLLQQFKKDLR